MGPSSANIQQWMKEFKEARFELRLCQPEQEASDGDVVIVTQGTSLRLLLLVFRTDKAVSAEQFQTRWSFNAAAADIGAEMRLHLLHDDAGDGNAVKPEKILARKACNLSLCSGGEVTAPDLTLEEKQHVADAGADVAYLVDTFIEVKPRSFDQVLVLGIHILVGDASMKATVTAGGFDRRVNGQSVESAMNELVRISNLPGRPAPTRVVTKQIKVVEPIVISTSYACSHDGSFISIQVENRHPSLDMFVRDVDFHLDHSVRSHEADDSAIVRNSYPRYDRSLSYCPQPEMMGDDTGDRGSTSLALPAFLSSTASVGPNPPATAPTTSTPTPNVMLHTSLNLGSTLSPGHPASPTPKTSMLGLTLSPRQRLAPGFSDASTHGGAKELQTSQHAKTHPPLPATPQPSMPLAPSAELLQDLVSPTNRGQNSFLPLSTLFRLFWVEKLSFPLSVKPGFRHGMVFRVEPFSALSEVSELFQKEEVLRGPFWTPLTIAYSVDTVRPGNDEVMFTDKVLSWDASAPLNQDFSMSIEVDPLVQLNEIFTATVTVVNLGSTPADLVLHVEKTTSYKAPMSAEYDGATYGRASRATPRSARRMRTYMDLRRLATKELSGEEGEDAQGLSKSGMLRSMSLDDEDEDDEDDDDDDDDAGPEGGGEEDDGGDDGRKGDGTWPVDATGTRRWGTCKGGRDESSNILILNTVAPIGLLNPLDEGTIQLQMLPLRPGLCRLTNLKLEDKCSGRRYLLDRPIEIMCVASMVRDAPLSPPRHIKTLFKSPRKARGDAGD